MPNNIKFEESSLVKNILLLLALASIYKPSQKEVMTDSKLIIIKNVKYKKY